MRNLYLICLLVLISACKKTENNLTKITAKTIAVDSTIIPSTEINNIIKPYKEKLNTNMKEVLTYSSNNLTKDIVDMQCNIGNLLADLCYKMANPIYKKKTNSIIDFTLLNYGGLRATIPKGNVTKEHAFKLMPFENELVVVTLTGKKVEELIQYFIDSKLAHPFCKNIELHLKNDNYTLKINGKVFDKNKTYNVLTNDFLQSGGDKMYFFNKPLKLTVIDYKMRSAIIDYFQKVDTLKTAIDKRVNLQ